MRFARRLAGLILLVALSGSCDSTQPLQAEAQNLQLSFKAVGAATRSYNVWDVFIDNDGDQVSDDGLSHLWCEFSDNSLVPSTVPWTFSVEITVLRAGETVAEAVTSAEALSPEFNVAEYDTLNPFPSTLQKSDICTLDGAAVGCPLGFLPPPGGNRYHFRNPRQERGANEAIMTAVTSPLFEEIRDDVPGSELGLGEGQCTEGNPGPARIDGTPQPFVVSINNGDTVIIKARMADEPPEQSGFSGLISVEDGDNPPTTISGSMTLDGREINLVGNTQGRAISFSYTSR